MNLATSRLKPPRTLVHPGPFSPVRIHSMRSMNARHIRLALEPGKSLFDALVKPLYAVGIRNASTTILGGEFSSLKYCLAPPDPDGHAVVTYSAPIEAGAALMIFGNATLGLNTHGAPIVHCHAAVRTSENLVKGGHIVTDQSFIGRNPVTVLVTSLDSFFLRVLFDPETNISLLQPAEVD